MTIISDQVLGADAASVSFSSISQAFLHLLMVLNGRLTQAVVDTYVHMQFNGDGGPNYDYQHSIVAGTTTSFSSNYGASFLIVGDWPGANSSSANQAGSSEVWIPNYTGTTFNKTHLATGGGVYSTSGFNTETMSWGGQWRNTSAITDILLTPVANNFKAGSRFTLYGV